MKGKPLPSQPAGLRDWSQDFGPEFQGSKRTGVWGFFFDRRGQDWDLGASGVCLPFRDLPGSAAAVSPASLAVGERMEISPQGTPEEETS